MAGRQFGRRYFLAVVAGGTLALGSACRGSNPSWVGRADDPSEEFPGSVRPSASSSAATLPAGTPVPDAVSLRRMVETLPAEVRAECRRQTWYADANPAPEHLALVRFLVAANENGLGGGSLSREKPLTVVAAPHDTSEAVGYELLAPPRQARIVRQTLYQSAAMRPAAAEALLVVASSHLERTRVELGRLLEQAAGLVPRVEAFLGPMRYRALHIQADLPGHTYLSSGANIFVLRDDAWGELSDFFLVHELSHAVSAPFDDVDAHNVMRRNAYPWWYSEGIAELTADWIVPGHRQHAGYIPAGDGGMVHLEAGRGNTFDGTVDREVEGGRGFELLNRVLTVLGEQSMASANRRVHEQARSGADILAIYYGRASDWQRTKLSELFGRFVDSAA